MVYVQTILDLMKICVIIPTYNESRTLAGLIKQIHAFQLPALVIDDGSTDDSLDVARKAGALTLCNEHNMGKGASLIKGFEYALTNGFDAVLTMDGDGQHQVSDIPVFLSGAAQDPGCGIIIGNRMARVDNMPFIRVLTNTFMSWLISRICRQTIPDSQCGFRLIKKEVLQKTRLSTRKFETESEILFETAKLGYRILSVPVKTIYSSENSHIKPVRDTIRFFKFIQKYRRRASHSNTNT